MPDSKKECKRCVCGVSNVYWEVRRIFPEVVFFAMRPER